MIPWFELNILVFWLLARGMLGTRVADALQLCTWSALAQPGKTVAIRLESAAFFSVDTSFFISTGNKVLHPFFHTCRLLFLHIMCRGLLD